MEGPNLAADADSTLKRLQTIEREVSSPDGRTFMMRFSPYRTMDERIDGVVITIVDIGERVRANELQRAGEVLETKVAERTRELATANESLRIEVADRKRAEEGRKDLLAQLVKAQEDERRRLALDLHDQLGQQLTALRLKLESLKTKAANRRQLNATVAELQAVVKRLDADVDFLAWQMRPAALDDLGLAAALSNYVRQWSEHFGIKAEFRAGGLEHRRLEPDIETNLYRIAQEALTNCAKHSKCSLADVLLERRDRYAVLIIEDNGVGFNPQQQREGDEQWGLIGMRERAALLDGTLEIESTPNKGPPSSYECRCLARRMLQDW